MTEQEREKQLAEWRDWTFNDTAATTEEKRLRKIISGAYLRLAKIIEPNAEARHAKEILRAANEGGEGTWP